MGALVSIETPVYNARYLADLIRSVLAQTFDDWNLNIMVDGDGGPALGRVVDRYGDHPRIHVFRQERQGTVEARRNLTTQTDSAYITTIDEDDMIMPGAVAALVERARTFPGAALVRTGMRYVGGKGVPTALTFTPPQRRFARGMTEDLFNVSQLYLFSRENYERVGGWEGDPAIRFGADSDLFAKLEEVGPFEIIREPLYLKRLHKHNLSWEVIGTDAGPGHVRWMADRMIARRGLDMEMVGFRRGRAGGFHQLSIDYRTRGGEILTLEGPVPLPIRADWERATRGDVRRWVSRRVRQALGIGRYGRER